MSARMVDMGGRVRRAARVVVAAAGLPLVGACGQGPLAPPDEITELPRALTVSEAGVIAASNDFAFALARTLSRPDSNFFISPLSASMALGMTLNGTAGETFEQMRSMLGFEGLGQVDINAAYSSLIDLLLNLDPAVDMAIGNSIWIDEGFPVLPSFLAAVEDPFDARVTSLDLQAPASSGVVNAWVDQATRGKIEEIVPDPIPDGIVMYLINAIYFKGSWTERFDAARTVDSDFHLQGGGSARVPLMSREPASLEHFASADLEAVDIPYGGKAFSMTVVLPSGGDDVETLLASLDADVWAGIANGLQSREMGLRLPRFGMTYERRLNDDLEALGMTDAFDDSLADFSRLASNPLGLYVDEVKQKTFVSVDEEGTEAAAVTSVGAVLTSAPPTFVVDRPFVFVLRERLTGTILFMGKVVDPTR